MNYSVRWNDSEFCKCLICEIRETCVKLLFYNFIESYLYGSGAIAFNQTNLYKNDRGMYFKTLDFIIPFTAVKTFVT